MWPSAILRGLSQLPDESSTTAPPDRPYPRIAGKPWSIPACRIVASTSSSSSGAVGREVLEPVLGDEQRVFRPDVQLLFGHAQRRIQREHDSRLERLAAIVADIMHRHADRMRHVIRPLQGIACALLVDRFRPARRARPRPASARPPPR